jgi:geranylgeranyl diphosphate synthase type II
VAVATEQLGKPNGRDIALCRPSSATELGLGGAIAHFDHLLAQAGIDSTARAGAPFLRALVRAESERLVPKATVRDLALAA